MRLAMVVRILWNGGVQRAAIEGAKAIGELGQKCDLIFIRETQSSYLLPPGTTILHPSSRDRERKWANPLKIATAVYARHRGSGATVDLDLMWESRTMMREYDMVIYVDQWAALIGIWNKLFHGKPFVLLLHEFFRRPPSGRLYPVLMLPAILLDRLAIASADAVVTTSSYNFNRLSTRKGRVWLARLGCAEAPQSAVPKKAQVLSLTVWDRGRNPWIYLRIAEQLPKVRFTLAGNWTEAELMEQVQAAAQKLPNVRITGSISEEERESLLEESLVYLRFGYAERGPGMGGLEALGHGCIVITNRDLGISELLTNGVNGFVVATDDPEAVGAIIEQVLSYDRDRLQRVQAAVRKLCGEISWRAHARVLLEATASAMAHGFRVSR